MISTGKISAATLIFLPIIFLATFAETFVSGRIEADRIWSADEDPYVASGKIIVESGAELTIESGVEILMQSGASIEIEGVLRAVGTASEPIKFVGASPGKGFWDALYFVGASSRNVSQLRFCQIEGGGKSRGAPILTNGAGNLICEEIKLSKNALNGAKLYDYENSSILRLNLAAAPYLFEDNFETSANQTVEISAGAVLKFGKQANFIAKGHFYADGAPGENIVFTSLADDYCDGFDSESGGSSGGVARDWGGFCLDECPSASLSYCQIKFGGGSREAQNALLFANDCDPKIEFCTFAESGYHGAICVNASRADFGGGEQNSAGFNIFEGFYGSHKALINKGSEKVLARNNCWNRSDSASVGELIHDSRIMESLGEVVFVPFGSDCAPRIPDPPKPIFPNDGDVDLDTELEFVVSSSFQASFNEIEIAEDSLFTEPMSRKSADTLILVKNLKFGQTYFWRARAENFLGVSDFSRTYRFATYDTSRPEPPRLIAPADGAENVDPSACFVWNESRTADLYRLEISRDEYFSNILFVADTLVDTTFLYDFSENDAEFYWRVKARNRNGWGDPSLIFSFKTAPILSLRQIYDGSIAAFAVLDYDDDGSNEIILIGPERSGALEIDGESIEFNELNLPKAADAEIVVSDFNGDNLPDLFVAGRVSQGEIFAGIFNNSGGDFYDISAGLIESESVKAVSFDFDSDGDYDLIYSGSSYGIESLRLFENSGGVLVERENAFPGIGLAEFDFADFDLDSDFDLAISSAGTISIFENAGGDFIRVQTIEINCEKIEFVKFVSDSYPDLAVVESGEGHKLSILKNENGIFAENATELASGRKLGTAFGDFDLDGETDFVLNDEEKHTFEIPARDGELIGRAFDYFKNAEIKPCDIDANGKLDVLILSDGRYLTQIRNFIAKKPTEPTAPTNLDFRFEGEDLILTWDATNNYDFNARIGLESVGNDFLSSLANASGFGKAVEFSNCGSSKTLRIRNLLSGEYYASVQSLDAAQNRSEFSNEIKIATPDMLKNPPANWRYEKQTGQNTTIVARAEINDAAAIKLESGDAIGVFFNRGSELGCAGYSIWKRGENIALTAWGDNYQTPEIKDGLGASEPFKFLIWKAAEGLEIPVSARIDRGVGYFEPDTLSFLKSFEPLDTFKMEIPAGRCVYGSSPVAAFDNSLETLFDVPEVFIEDIDRNKFIPSLYETALSEWNFSQAYKIYSPDSLEATFVGDAIESTEFPIKVPRKRAAFIPFLSQKEATPEEAFASIAEDLILVKNHRGECYAPRYGIDQIKVLYPGEGYKIIAENETTLIYPENPDLPEIYGNEPLEASDFDIPYTGSTEIFSIKSDDLVSGGEIVCFEESGEQVGAASTNDASAGLAVWGDNLFTDEVDGAEILETLKLGYRPPESDDLRQIEIITATDLIKNEILSEPLKFREDAFIELTARVGGVLNVDRPRFTFDTRIYPNPFEEFISIKLATETAGKANVEILDLLGNRIIFDEIDVRNPGEFLKNLNTADLASGIYLLKLTVDQKSEVYKIVKK